MKKIILISISIIIILNIMFVSTFAMTFSDLPYTHWAYDNIISLADKGVINGYTDGTYKPGNAVTRGEFFKLIMVSLYGSEEYFDQNLKSFGHWSMPYAFEAARNGYLMNGTTVSGLNDEITRKEMVNILAKICINNKIEKAEKVEAISFSDIDDIDEETKLYIVFVTKNGLINGYTDGTFKPDRTMTRAEVATVISRFLNLAY